MKKSKVILFLLTLCILFTSITYGAGTFPGANSWALNELNKGVSYGLITPEVFKDYSKATTREEFCKLAVVIYEKLSGKAATVPSTNPFTDTNNEIILKAYNAGIVKGTSDKLPTTFKPNDKISREQQAVMIDNIIKACLIDQTVTGTSKDFADIKTVSPWALSQVKFLRNAGIMNGDEKNCVNPKSNVTREQSILLAVRTYETYREKLEKFKIGASEIQIGESVANVVKKLGEPLSKEMSNYDFEWYIYNKSYGNYVQIGVLDNKVSAIYSNSRGFTFGSLRGGSTWDEAKKKMNINQDFSQTVAIKQNGVTTNLYFDESESKRLTAVMIISDKAVKMKTQDENFLESQKRQIFNIINAERSKMGKGVLTLSETLSSVATSHNKEMAAQNYLSDTNLSGQDLQERLNIQGIKAKLYGENITSGYISAVEIYTAWLCNLGHWENMLFGDYSQIGIGIAKGSVTYCTVDFITE